MFNPKPDAAVQPRAGSVCVNSENGRLRRVVIGNPEHFVLPEPINRKQELYNRHHPERPTRDTLRPEFAAFRALLESQGVEVIQPVPVPGVPDQLTPRDIGFVVGDVFVVATMTHESRRQEWRGIQGVLDALPPERIVRVPPDVIVEGGDIVLHDDTLFVGISERTNEAGAAFLAQRFGDEVEVVPVHLRSDQPDEDILHLDCAFVPVGDGQAIIYPDGFREIPEAIRRYDWIEVSRDEQQRLGTNVLSISPTTIISREAAVSVNERLSAAGFEVLPLRFRETPKSGGSVRCASLPLMRDDV